MAMINRITDDEDTVDLLSDDFTLNTSGWAPNAADEGRVPESLSINILNGVPGGGTATGSAWQFAQNKTKLKRLLRKAQRFGLGDSTVSPVRWEYAPQHGDPAMLHVSLIVGWDETQFLPPTFNDADGQTTEQLNGVTLNIVRQAPWAQTEYLNVNLLASTAQMLNWTGSPSGAPTNSYSPVGAYGGRVYREVPGAVGAERFSSDTFAVVSGQTYELIFSYGSSASPPACEISLTDSGFTSDLANILSFQAAANIDIHDGVTYRGTFIANATDATARLTFYFDTGFGQQVDIGEVMLSALAETWHPLYSEISESNTTLAAQTPSVHEMLFTGDLDTPSPVVLTIDGFDIDAPPIINPGYIILTDQEASNGLVIMDWDTVSGPFANVADTAHDALGGNVNRFTPAGITEITAGAVTGLALWKGRIQFYVAVRNNSATTTFWLWVEMSRANLSASTRRVAIPPYAGVAAMPQIVSLGEVSSIDGFDTLKLWYQASAASGTLDVDYLARLRMTDQTYVIPHGTFDAASYLADPYALRIDPRTLASVAPEIVADDGTTEIVPDYHRGDLALTMTGTRLSATWLATYTDGVDNYWRHVDGGGAPIEISMQATRLPSTDIPL